MSFFSNLEDNLGKYIEGFFKEGFFKDKFGSSTLQPVEIAKKIAKEMRSRSRTGLNEIYVPNRFEILLSSEDYGVFLPIMERMSSEMVDYVKHIAKEKDYTLLGLVAVSFTKRQSLTQGQLRIKAFFDEREETSQAENKPDDTLRFVPVRGGFLSAGAGVSSGSKGILEIAEGSSLEGKRFVISSTQIVLGRDEICDIVIPDNSISRRHAIISRQGHRFFIKDRSSTNGTYINGEKITQGELSDGDEMRVGNTVFIFKVG